MSDHGVGANGEVQQESKVAVRLRVLERRQMAWVAQCADDLVAAGHPVRMVMAVVERLDVRRFAEPIRARKGWRGGTRPIRGC